MSAGSKAATMAKAAGAHVGRKVLVGAVALAILVGWGLFRTKDLNLEIGSCIQVPSGVTTENAKKVNCDTETGPNFIVAYEVSNAAPCDKNYVSYTITARKSTSSRYCLIENVKEGICYVEATGKLAGYEQAPCDSKAQFKVAKVVLGTADEGACGADDEAAVYAQQPQRTVCLTSPE